MSVVSSANAAYPVYQAAYPAGHVPTVAGGNNMYLPSSNSRIVSTTPRVANGYQNVNNGTNGRMVSTMPQVANGYQNTSSGTYTRTNAAQPTRITGQLPRVGATATNAGRQYYQAADYDRLADSGLYIGLSAAYAMSVSGGMDADYKNEDKAFVVPGAFKTANLILLFHCRFQSVRQSITIFVLIFHICAIRGWAMPHRPSLQMARADTSRPRFRVARLHQTRQC